MTLLARGREPSATRRCRCAPARSPGRCTNLVGNAARHGSRVLLTVRLSGKWLAFVVEDDGPGIPEADRARAVQPFTRLEAARPQTDGGSVGLGLSIAMDVARSHGGTLELGESPELGGLRATFRVPR